jgi:hypothetical protein
MTGEMDPVAAAASTGSTDATTTSDSTTKKSGASTTPSKDFASYLKDGEKLETVPDHKGYELIQGGKRDGEYLNVTNNKRMGEAFKIETDNGKIMHVYGHLRIVVGEAAKTTSTSDSGDSKSTGSTTGTTGTTGSGGTAAPQSSSTSSSSSSSNGSSSSSS